MMYIKPHQHSSGQQQSFVIQSSMNKQYEQKQVRLDCYIHDVKSLSREFVSDKSDEFVGAFPTATTQTKSTSTGTSPLLDLIVFYLSPSTTLHNPTRMIMIPSIIMGKVHISHHLTSYNRQVR